MLTLFILSGITLFLIFLKLIKTPSHLKSIPRVSPWYPILGNVSFLLSKSSEEVFETFNSLFASHDRLFQLWFGPLPIVCVSHPDLIRELLTSSKSLEKPLFYRFSRIDQGLWAANAKLWHSQRKALNTTFSMTVLDGFVPIFERFSKSMVEQLYEKRGSPVNFLQFSTTCTLAMVCHTSMGSKGSDREEMEKLAFYMNKITEAVSHRFITFYLHPEMIYRLTPSYRQEMKYREHCYNFTQGILDENRRKTQSEKTRKNFIEQLMNGTTKRSFSDTEIVQNVYNLIAAGSETSALTIAHACLLLAMFPEIQQKVYSEIELTCPDPSETLTLSDLSNLTYMEMFLKECLRLCPVAPMIARENGEQFTLDGVDFPKGTVFLVNYYALHRRSDLWGPDWDQFRPERFCDVESRRHPYAYLPFSGGPRNCIGYRYAMISLKVMIVHLLRRFRLSTELRYEDLRFRFGMLIENSSGYMIQFKER